MNYIKIYQFLRSWKNIGIPIIMWPALKAKKKKKRGEKL